MKTLERYQMNLIEMNGIKDVKSTLDKLKKEGYLAEEEICVQYKGTRNIKHAKFNYVHYFMVCDSITYCPLKNPVTQQDWKVSYMSKNQDPKDIDNICLCELYVYTCKYKNKSSGFYNELIEPKSHTLRLKTKIPAIYQKLDETLKESFETKLGGEYTLLGIIKENTTSLIQKYFSEQEEGINDQLDDLNEKLEMYREILDENKRIIEQQYSDIEALEAQEFELRNSIELFKSKREELSYKYGYLEFQESSKNNDMIDELYEMATDGTCFEAIQQAIYHQSQDNLVYDLHILRQFVCALFTDQLILLFGPSGIGKSSLVLQMEQIFTNVKVHVIAVQSGWTDETDLLGFYNPVKNCYYPTTFMQGMVEAKEDKDTLHIFCFDEMNLAHIEYYFASILSTRENKKKRSLNLYASKYYKSVIRFFQDTFNKDPHDITEEDIKGYNGDRQTVRELQEQCLFYPAEFIIPNNVRFVGTLNMDETVKPISPKVTDRSFVIEMFHAYDFEKIKDRLKENTFEQKIFLSPDKLDSFTSYTPDEEVDKTIQEVMVLSNLLNIIPNVAINSRGKEHLTRYANCYKNMTGENFKNYSNAVIDDMICAKLLPRIQFNRNDNEELRKQFSKLVKKVGSVYPRAKNKLMIMNEDKRFVRFWI